MANQQHLDVLKQGMETWNKWRQEYPDIQPDLSETHLHKIDLGMVLHTTGPYPVHTEKRVVNLRGCKLYSTDLVGSNLHGADLRNADLQGSNLSRADLREANLGESNLTNVYLYGTDLTKADLTGADVTRAVIGMTIFGDIDLRGVLALKKVFHEDHRLSGRIRSIVHEGSFQRYSSRELVCLPLLSRISSLW
jgi:uncharacterized protein YjbI with pentapeptide repeats